MGWHEAPMKLVIIDPGSGNLASVLRAFQKVAAESGIAAEISVTRDAAEILAADRVVLPGQGAFAACRRGLDALPGAIAALQSRVRGDGVPFLGICVGMQLMATLGREYEDTDGLNWVAGEVTRITPTDPTLKVPHMGWNDLVLDAPHPVFDGIKTGDHTYFVHSYHMAVKNPAQRLAHVDYASEVTAVIGRDNMIGMQFHPEKSAAQGLTLYRIFPHWNP